MNESELLRLGIRTALEAAEDFQVIGEFALDEGAIEKVGDLEPDLVLMSLQWPELEEVNICRNIMSEFPSVKVIMVSHLHSEKEMIASMIAGATGYLSVNASISELGNALQTVLDGGIHFNWGDTAQIISVLRIIAENEQMSKQEPLSDRELSILALIGDGYGNEEIGLRLSIATTTVRNNITMIRSKLGLNSRTKLVVYAIRNGLYDSSDEIRNGR